jgi:hypothetical protein
LAHPPLCAGRMLVGADDAAIEVMQEPIEISPRVCIGL